MRALPRSGQLRLAAGPLSLSLPLVMASRLMGVEASLANGGVQAGLVENPGEDNHDMRVSLLGLPSLSVVEVPLFLLYSL